MVRFRVCVTGLFVLLSCLVLSGCGQKGDLVHPDQQSSLQRSALELIA